MALELGGFAQEKGRAAGGSEERSIQVAEQTPSSQNNQLTRKEIVHILDKTVSWRQHFAMISQSAVQSIDILFINENQPAADEVLRLSFEFARAGVQYSTENRNDRPKSSTSGDSGYRTLAETSARLDSQSNRLQSDLKLLQRQLVTAPRSRQKALKSSIEKMQSELTILQSRQDLVHDMLKFMDRSAEPADLSPQIDAWERSAPMPLNSDSHTTGQASSQTGTPGKPAISSHSQTNIWGKIGGLYELSGKVQIITESIRETDDLMQSARQLQVPMRASLTELVQQSEKIMNEPSSQDPSVLFEQRAALDRLTGRYKLLGSALVPLSKELILLDAHKKNLTDWRNAVKGEYSADLKGLLFHVIALSAIFGIVLGMFILWRRAILRYVPDLRRRYQLLLLRRIALWFVVGLVVILALVSELGSLITFAGLLTAGIAVALQNVILAMLGYFLLIGKFGVQVGDRVQISGVLGEVVEINLIRLHIMELSSPAGEAQPTGRVVAFSNAVVFQPNAGLFRQIPGGSLNWHEITLTLAPESDYREVEQRIVAAVGTALKDYEQDFERMRLRMETNLSSVSISLLSPRVRVKLLLTGLEVLIRFPVLSEKSVEIDGRVKQELVRAIETEPRLKVVGAEVPTLQIGTSEPRGTPHQNSLV